MRMRLPPKNMNQGIYWVSTYLKYNLDKSPKPKSKQPTKQELYRKYLYDLLDCFESGEEYPDDIIDYLNEINRVLSLKTINQKHIDKINLIIGELVSKYKKSPVE